MPDALVIAPRAAQPDGRRRRRQPGARSARRAPLRRRCDLLVCSELALVGYPPEDLVLRPAVHRGDPARGRGAGGRHRDRRRRCSSRRRGRTAAPSTTRWSCSADGRIAAVRYKHELPNYGVFDEKRVFARGTAARAGRVPRRAARRADLRGHLVPGGGARISPTQGAELLIVPERVAVRAREAAISASRWRPSACARPGCRSSTSTRSAARTSSCSTAARSSIDRDGAARRPPAVLERDDARHAWTRAAGGWTLRRRSALAPLPDEPQNTYQALMLGLRDYVNKNGFPASLLGLSGGIDSALTAAVAVDALGADRVRGVRLPSRFTSDESQDDADVEAQRLGMRLDTIPIARRRRRRRARAGAAVRRPRARHHRGEHPGARARPAADGGVEQVRRDAADDRQQVGDVGRLRDALRRHVRRLLGAEGPLQDRGLRARRVAQPLRARGRARSGGRGRFRESC